MQYFLNIFIFLVFAHSMCGQSKLDKTLKKYNSENVPYIQVKEVTDASSIVLLDTRKIEEYNISHLKDAVWVGYDAFEAATVLQRVPDKNTPIIVYCSIGVRSENIGEKLQKLGYTDVKNLYGGIFAWKNNDNSVYNNQEKVTDSVHAFDKHWGKLLHKGIKVYDTPVNKKD